MDEFNKREQEHKTDSPFAGQGITPVSTNNVSRTNHREEYAAEAGTTPSATRDNEFRQAIATRIRTDYPRRDAHKEEYASEVTSPEVTSREAGYSVRDDRKADAAVKRTDLYKKDREEYAAEVAPAPSVRRDEVRTSDDAENRNAVQNYGRTAGYVGVGFGVLSLFMWSIILGPLAAVIGFYAYSQGSKVWGGWAMGLGILATISYFVLVPFAR
ncbi:MULTISPECIES: hypothetical protein [Paenibacillus]|uniref:hypothetical protein n=1 Tax=Paenibacillus TaxID=44249 RepID=UPI00267C8792|nr:hypothetical protein [Paenibacillus sp. PSB04]